MIKYTKEIIQEKSNLIHNSNYQIIGEYVNNNSKIEIKHLVCSTIFFTTSSIHLNGKGGCSKCFKNVKKTKEILQCESNIIHNSEYEIIGDYISTDTKIEIKHLICENYFYQTPDKHLHNNKCPICYGNNKLTKEVLQNRSDEKYNNEYIIIGEYINNSTLIEIKHIPCGNVNKQTPNNHLKRKCFNCYSTPKKTIEQIQKRSNEIHNNEYEIIGEYKNSNSTISILHKLCGIKSQVIAYTHLKGAGCKYCSTSKGEKKIQKILNNLNIEYESNKSFSGCTSINKLRFDFYLSSYNMCIEYDGIQHFKPVEWFGGEDALKQNNIRDKIKNKYCIENNIILHRISYLDNIEDKLKEIFNI